MIWRYKKSRQPTENIGISETICSVSISVMMLLIITGLVLRENLHEGQKTSKIRRAT